MRLRSVAWPTFFVTVRPKRNPFASSRTSPCTVIRSVWKRRPEAAARNSRRLVRRPGAAPSTGRAHGSRILGILGGQAFAAVGAPGREHLAAALRLHAGTETMPALANELARLIGPLHGLSPVARGRHARGLAG